MKKCRLLFVLFFFVVACTSSIHRAAVRDITKKTKAIAYNKKGGYRAGSTYIVKFGDTLLGIALQANVSFSQLVLYNNLKSPYLIKEGQVLNLKQNQTVNEHKYSDQYRINSKITQKTQQKVAPKKAKTYSKKYIVKKNGTKEIVRWVWPSNGKLIKGFSFSDTELQGIRIAAKRDSAVNAAADGKVVYVGSGLRGYGKLIIIKHNNDYLSAYAHNDKLLVKEDQKVKKGQKIALMGDTGANKVYLHFEIRYKGKSVDPLQYLPKR